MNNRALSKLKHMLHLSRKMPHIQNIVKLGTSVIIQENVEVLHIVYVN